MSLLNDLPKWANLPLVPLFRISYVDEIDDRPTWCVCVSELWTNTMIKLYDMCRMGENFHTNHAVDVIGYNDVFGLEALHRIERRHDVDLLAVIYKMAKVN